MKPDHLPTPHTKINSKCVKYLNIRPKAIKLLDENTGSKLLDICLGDDFFGFNTEIKCNKSKQIKWDYIQLKNFIAKETVNKIKRHGRKKEWEKIFTNHIFDKGLISKIHKRTHTAQQQKHNLIKK